jgi:catechol 2,3-dioxygenase-like lactoylglutathione lyase family enzyme
MPRLDGLKESALYVTDMERSAAFYVKLLGLEAIDRDERIIAMSVAGRQVLLLCLRGASVAHGHDAIGQQHICFAIPAAELPRWEEWLAENGITIELRKQWKLGGSSLYFRDPDGHLLELATPGVWSIDLVTPGSAPA